MNMALSAQSKDALSYSKARKRAQEFYTESLISQQGKDHSLHIVNSIIDEYTGLVSKQEFTDLQIGLTELTSEQLLRLVDENARLIKVAANDKLQIVTSVFCVITAALTVVTLLSAGTATVPTAAARAAGISGLRKFILFTTTKLGTLYSSTIGKMLLVSEVAGDAYITSQEIVNVWNEAADPNVRSDRDAWLRVSSLMSAAKQKEAVAYQYIMKPSEMMALLAIWERGDRAALDPRLRNLIYGKSVYFPSDMATFQKIKFRISRIGLGVERQIGTPSLFPAFSLVLRVLGRFAAAKGAPIVSPLIAGTLWLFRFKQFDENQRR
jgi:hypothetical protein